MAVGAAPELAMAVNAPVATGLIWFLIILLFISIVPKATELLMAVKAPVPALVPEIMLFPVMVSVPIPAVLVVIPIYIEASVPPAVHPVMLFPVMVTLLPATLVMPVNEFINAALPVTSPDMTLSVMDMAPVAPELIAVIAAAAAVDVEILLIVFAEMVLAPAVTDIAVTAAEPPVQLLNVFVLKVLFKLVLVFDHPVITVAPVAVTFEKLLLFWVMEDPLVDVPLPEQNVMVPPAPVFEKPVTMELALTVCTPVALKALLTVMKVTLPVVLTLKFVNVLLLIFCDNVAAVLAIYLCTLDPVTA